MSELVILVQLTFFSALLWTVASHHLRIVTFHHDFSTQKINRVWYQFLQWNDCSIIRHKDRQVLSVVVSYRYESLIRPKCSSLRFCIFSNQSWYYIAL